ncbi:MAG: hypothetical protein ACFFC1_11760, partial [Promethearchaeota archaeon]
TEKEITVQLVGPYNTICITAGGYVINDYFDIKTAVEPAIIEGELQDAVEGRFIQHLRKLGITSRSLTKESGAQRYFVLFDWVCRDFPYRERFVKTGFPSWEKKWRKIAMRRYEKNHRNKSDEMDKIKKRAEEICEFLFEKPKSLREVISES